MTLNFNPITKVRRKKETATRNKIMENRKENSQRIHAHTNTCVSRIKNKELLYISR